MAYKIIRQFTNQWQEGDEITAILDSTSDLASLGTEWCPGSIAIVADEGTPVYILNASGEWKEQ